MYREIGYNYQHKLDILLVPLLLIVMADRISQEIKHKAIKEWPFAISIISSKSLPAAQRTTKSTPAITVSSQIADLVFY